MKGWRFHDRFHQLDFNIKDEPHFNEIFDKSNLDQITYLLVQ